MSRKQPRPVPPGAVKPPPPPAPPPKRHYGWAEGYAGPCDGQRQEIKLPGPYAIELVGFDADGSATSHRYQRTTGTTKDGAIIYRYAGRYTC